MESLPWLPAHLQKALMYEKSGLNLLHGELKNLMLKCEEESLSLPVLTEDYDLGYITGMSDAYDTIYQLTYLLSLEGAL